MKSKFTKIVLLSILLMTSTMLSVSANKKVMSIKMRNMQQNSYTPFGKKTSKDQFVEMYVNDMGFDKLCAWYAGIDTEGQDGPDYYFVKGTTIKMKCYNQSMMSTLLPICIGMENANWSLNTTTVKGWYDYH